MRLRRNRQGEALLDSLPGMLAAAPGTRDGARDSAGNVDWAAVFGRPGPLHVEIGMGKGDFLLALAARRPGINFVGVEKSLTVLYIAARKNRLRPLPNLRFLPADAGDLNLYFGPGQLERIYLNFSDPWPKNRHRSRRLTCGQRLADYGRLLAPGGQIHFKTDQKSLFDFTLTELIRQGWSVGKITGDLYRSGIEDNVASEYERRFTALGRPIYRLEAWNGAADD